MKILTIVANPNPRSFSHAILQRLDQGLRDAGHAHEIIDLYAERFDPVFRTRDFASYIDDSIPLDLVKTMDLRRSIMENAGGPLRRLGASILVRNKGPYDLIKLIRSQMPKDVVAHQRKLREAQGLAFISPVYWMAFPGLLKGWFERVFTPGFAYSLTPEGWHGDAAGRIPLLSHEKALIISTTHFSEKAYRGAFGEAMTAITDDWGLRYPGVKKVEHVYFYGVDVSTDEARRDWLDRAYRLGKEFSA
jgi:NAD(P)H dehydrogenase (quinone)